MKATDATVTSVEVWAIQRRDPAVEAAELQLASSPALVQSRCDEDDVMFTQSVKMKWNLRFLISSR